MDIGILGTINLRGLPRERKKKRQELYNLYNIDFISIDDVLWYYLPQVLNRLNVSIDKIEAIPGVQFRRSTRGLYIKSSDIEKLTNGG